MASARRAESQSRWTAGQGEAGNRVEKGIFPTMLQGTRDLFKYLWIYVIHLIRFPYLTSYSALICWVLINPALKAGGRWYLLVCSFQSYVEQFYLQVLVALVPPSVVSTPNNPRLHWVKMQSNTAHLGRTDSWKQFGPAEKRIFAWKEEKLSARPFLTLKIESPRLAALSARCFLTFRCLLKK